MATISGGMREREVTTDTVSFTLREDGIVVGRAVNPDRIRTAEDVATSFDQLDEMTGGVRMTGLWDPRALRHFPAPAWRMLVSRLEQSLLALAIMTDEHMESALGGFPRAIDSFLIPVRLFRDEAAAIEWLSQFGESDTD